MWLTNADVHQCTRFVFDVEFIGDITQDPLACKIWEIGCVCVDTGLTFSQTMIPNMHKEEIDSAFDNGSDVTHDKLLTLGAVPIQQGLERFVEWVKNNTIVTRKTNSLFMAHACFRSDSIVLDSAMREHDVAFPTPVIYFDTLLYLRYLLRGHNLTDFSLASIVEHLGTTKHAPEHRALPDAQCLADVLKLQQHRISGLGITVNELSTTLVDGIGVAAARLLDEHGFTSIQSVVTHMRSSPGGRDYLQGVLQGILSVSSNMASVLAGRIIDVGIDFGV